MVASSLQGVWVARVSGAIVASGPDVKQVFADAEKVALRSRIELEWVPSAPFISGFHQLVASAAGGHPGVKPLSRKARDELAEKLYG